MRKTVGCTSALALLMLAVSPQTALAAPAEMYSYAERVDFAAAVWLAETENSTTSLEIHVFNRDDRSTDLGPLNSKDPGMMLFFRHRQLDPVTGMIEETNFEGFSGGAGADFEFDRSLARAEVTLSLRLYGWRCTFPADGGSDGAAATAECEEIGEPVVAARVAWTGVGPIGRDTFNLRGSEPPGLISGSHLVQAIRDADVQGTIAGEGLHLADGGASYGVLLRGKYNEQSVLPQPSWLGGGSESP